MAPTTRRPTRIVCSTKLIEAYTGPQASALDAYFPCGVTGRS